ncbi:TetR/AcrR family transcriptional regulator [Conexibacter stalactiti]|uniref:TetR/AcrR family transcriptional regulator n=1 Tax=Conexibacter stalactiti TaxID=1940611 RepID=A0ABU4HTM5_9ACTN|nr:TetR/AcrR family transcriptional regulator [Conexibacter stalactiti]MDW5596636.1 TetR/AcrR family transcriptional regulator [Conexibacter stalactiti]MEC5037278.1 TetR/AcrR family transcriptional regulator [Conexibacter stalactiti]
MTSLSRRTEAQTEKRAAVERSVLEATEALLAEGASYAELGIERIATRAGISRTAFYFYFRDKRELLMRLTAGIAEELFAEAERWWSGEGEGEPELRAAIAKIVDIYRRHPALLRAVVEAAAYDDEAARFWRALVGRFADSTQARIEREQAAGTVDPALPAQATAFALVWMTERSAYERLVQEDAVGEQPLIEALLRIWLCAVYGAPQHTG